MPDKICYCFDLTRDDIVADLTRHAGRSTLVEKIKEAKHSGECRCEELHPLGR